MRADSSFNTDGTGEFPELPDGHEVQDCSDCHTPLCLLIKEKPRKELGLKKLKSDFVVIKEEDDAPD